MFETQRMSRKQRRPRREQHQVQQLPWQSVHNPYAPIEVISRDHVEAIIERALQVLERKGMRVLDEQCRAVLVDAGADHDRTTDMVRLPAAMVMDAVRKAPASFTLKARNSAHDLRLGGNELVFAAVGGPAFVSDIDRGRRPGTMAELIDYFKLIQSLNILHQEGGMAFEPMDLPASTRHLDTHLAQYRYLDKNAQCYPLGRDRTVDGIRMAGIALQLNEQQLLSTPSVLGIINTNSPMQLDIPMGEAVLELAAAGQVSCITPFTLAGSMSPATLAGTLVQQTAEVLAVVTLAQQVRPGAPVMYGAFASNVDMKSGAPALGTPEYSKATLASGQIARALGLPFRSSNTNVSNTVDAQASYESQMSLWSAVMGNANLVNHAAGWLEGGLTASFEKLIIDAEMLQMMAEFMSPIKFNEDEFALSSILETEPGGHHFGTEHTLQRYEHAFYTPMLSQRSNFENWQESGSPDTALRANQIWKKLLAEYQQPELDQAIDEELEAYVAARKEYYAALK